MAKSIIELEAEFQQLSTEQKLVEIYRLLLISKGDDQQIKTAQRADKKRDKHES